MSVGYVCGTAMARNLYFLGTAGSGKSTMVFAFQLWMNSQGLDCITANLDPGAEALQYSPDLDVRDYVSIEEIMAEQGLGPNGAQVAAADMIAMNAKELADVLETFQTNYVLIDTPGQIELFTFRASGPVLIDAFGREDSALVYLNDPALVRSPSGFISSILLNATVQFRHGLPFINVLSKADLLPEPDLERIVKWSVDSFALYEALFEEAATPKTLLDVEFLKSMETIGVYRRVYPVSSEITFGFEEIYSQVQLAFEGGEDLSKD
jgi:GTPase SAR1 family protein